MENVQWGVPLQRVAKREEKFKTPVITMSSLAKKGSGRKFQFNKAAIDALGLEPGETYVTIGFSNDRILVMSSNSENNPSSLKITKQYSFSNKRTYEYISKIKELDNNVENYLHLVPLEGQSYMLVNEITSENTVAENNNEDVIEEEIVIETIEEEVETEENW